MILNIDLLNKLKESHPSLLTYEFVKLLRVTLISSSCVLDILTGWCEF